MTLPSKPTEDRGWVDLLGLIAGARRLLAGAVIAGAAVAAAVAFLLPDTYTARTVILPPQQSQSLAPALMGQLGALAMLGGRDLGMRSMADLYGGILQSDTIATGLVNRFGLVAEYRVKHMSEARKKLAKATTISVRPKEGLVDVEVNDRSPERAAEMANAYIEGLCAMNAQLALTEASQRRLFFEEQLKTTKGNLERAESAMKDRQEASGLLQVDSQAKAALQSTAALSAEIAAKEVQLRAMKTYATDRNPNVVVANEELAGLRAQMARLQAGRGGPGDTQIGARRLPAAGLEYIRNLRELTFQESLFELLTKQYEAARIDEAKSSPVIQVIDRATPPDRRSGPPRAIIIAAGAVTAALLALAYAIARDRRRVFVASTAAGGLA